MTIDLGSGQGGAGDDQEEEGLYLTKQRKPRKPMSEEAKEKARQNLAKAREKALEVRKANAAKRRNVTDEVKAAIKEAQRLEMLKKAKKMMPDESDIESEDSSSSEEEERPVRKSKKKKSAAPKRLSKREIQDRKIQELQDQFKTLLKVTVARKKQNKPSVNNITVVPPPAPAKAHREVTKHQFLNLFD